MDARLTRLPLDLYICSGLSHPHMVYKDIVQQHPSGDASVVGQMIAFPLL